MRDPLSADEIRNSLLLSVTYIHGAAVVGDVAEFGTMSGRTATILAQAIKQHNSSRRLMLFDSFEGLPTSTSAVDSCSPHVRSGVWSSGTCKGLTSQQLRDKCAEHLPNTQIEIHEGWFADTLRKLHGDTRFALIHIDSDLYKSAVDVLDYCFANRTISRGAAVHFDDWDCNQADPRFGERLAWRVMVDKFAVNFTDCGQYGWGSRKFIVHSYLHMDEGE